MHPQIDNKEALKSLMVKIIKYKNETKKIASKFISILVFILTNLRHQF